MMRSTIAVTLTSFVVSTLACDPVTNFKMTFYGWADNSPPGPNVAMNCGGRNGKAAGTGTYEDPLTMAAQVGRFADCELVYSPYLKKYLRLEDTCAACTGNWVDVWTGSFTSNPGSGLQSCQNSLTGSFSADHTIIQAPPNGLEVVATGLFEGGVCNTGVTFAQNDANASCAGGSTPSTPTVPSAAPPAASNTIPAASPSSTGKKSWRGRTRKGKAHRGRS